MQTAITLLHQTRAAAPILRAWLSRRGACGRALAALLMPALEPGREPAPVLIPVRRPAPRAVLGLVVAATALFAASPALAWQRHTDWRPAALGNLVDVQVQVEGERAPLYFRPGYSPFVSDDDRWYFQAFRGRNYALRIHNRTGRRVGVLIAVDGLNVVNGERSSLARTEAMYVLDPYESAVIRGWRTSLDDVRRFVFVDEERSYAERTGQANRDMGWIRVLAFSEAGQRIRPFLYNQPERGPYRDDRVGERDELGGAREEKSAPAPVPQSAVPAPGAAQDEARARKQGEAPRTMLDGMAPRAESVPGTGWGDRRRDPVQETWFVAASRPRDHLVFRYEYESGLRALGIEPYRDRLWEREHGQLGFARPPKW